MELAKCAFVAGVQANIMPSTSGDAIWNVRDQMNKRFEVNHEMPFGAKPVYVKIQEFQGLAANSNERPKNRSVP